METELTRFGPYRAIGLSYIAGNGNFDFPGVWDRFMKIIAGRISIEGKHYFGICRCIPGPTDGTWEYIAAAEVAADERAPEGLVEVAIPGGEYVVTDVASLKEIGEGWKASRHAVEALAGYEPFCGRNGCACATHPAFEHYAPDFRQTGRLAIFSPVRRA